MAIGNGWQANHPNNPHSTHIDDLLFDEMPEFLSKQMSFLPEDTKIIYVGNRIPGLEKYLYGRICNMHSCGIDCFNNMLYACDVFLTMNMSSTTLAKAIYAGIPSVVLTNPYEMCGPDDVDSVFAALGVGEDYEYQWARKNTPLSKFRIAPVGLYYVMEKLMQDNRYFKAMVEVNMFDRNKVLTTIRRLLSQDNGDSELMQQRNRYFAEISAEQPNGFIDRFNQLVRQIV